MTTRMTTRGVRRPTTDTADQDRPVAVVMSKRSRRGEPALDDDYGLSGLPSLTVPIKKTSHWMRLHFNCLRCSLCKDFYVADPSDPKSPRLLSCAIAVCKSCFDAEQSKKNEELLHKCPKKYATCFSNEYPAFFLFDLITYFKEKIFAQAQGPSHIFNSIEKIGVLACSTCLQPYSLSQRASVPFDLICGHTCCFGCFCKMRVNRNGDGRRDSARVYKITCSCCQQETFTSREKTYWNELRGFLEQLDALKNVFNNVVDLSKSAPATIFKCRDCERKIFLDDTWQCVSCDKLHCSTCFFLRHKSHKARRISEIQLASLAEEKGDVVKNRFDTFSTYVPAQLHHIQDNYERLFKSMDGGVQSVKEGPFYDSAFTRAQQCTELNNRFERFVQEFMPSLQRYTKNIQELAYESYRKFQKSDGN